MIWCKVVSELFQNLYLLIYTCQFAISWWSEFHLTLWIWKLWKRRQKNTKGKDTNIRIKTRRTTKKEEKAEKDKKKAKKIKNTLKNIKIFSQNVRGLKSKINILDETIVDYGPSLTYLVETDLGKEEQI